MRGFLRAEAFEKFGGGFDESRVVGLALLGITQRSRDRGVDLLRQIEIMASERREERVEKMQAIQPGRAHHSFALLRLGIGARFAGSEVADLVDELRHVAEFLVDGGEPHVSDLIHFTETLHDVFADGGGRDLAVVVGFDGVEDVFEEHGDLLVVDRALVAGGADGAEKFFAVERLLAPVAFDDHEAVADERLGGGEAVAALQTLAAAARDVTVAPDAGVDHLVLDGSALGAAHGGQFSERKFWRIFIPPSVAMDSGWNWTPETANSLWRRPMISPSAVSAVTSRQSGNELAFDEQRVIACGGKRGGQARKNVGAAMKNWREFAVHLARRADDVAAEKLADGLVAEAHAEHGLFSGESLYDVDAYAGVGRGAGAGRNEDSARVELLGLSRGDLVVAEDAHGHAQLAEILDEVEGERVVVVDDEEHVGAPYEPLTDGQERGHRGSPADARTFSVNKDRHSHRRPPRPPAHLAWDN